MYGYRLTMTKHVSARATIGEAPAAVSPASARAAQKTQSPRGAPALPVT